MGSELVAVNGIPALRGLSADIVHDVERWRARATDEEVAGDLAALIDEGDPKNVENSFFRSLEFGTGGLRGVIGAGTNRMNVYTVGQATQGLADYLLSLPARDDGARKSVAIAHDSRIDGELFARTAARVLAGNGIQACLYPRLEPTPALSFAVRDLGCDAGINVTASHNPAIYNGYKAYGPDGCQITSEYARGVSAAISQVDIFDGVRIADFDDASDEGLIAWIGDDTLARFIDACKEADVTPDATGALKLVYTPLNGTGLECMHAILDRIGVTDVTVVPEQEKPDGQFPTCPFPNPEIREALQKGIELSEQVGPDLLLATDPDADRVGVAVKDGDDYTLLSGNEMGILLFDFVCRMRTARGAMPASPVCVSTIVSTQMIDAIGARYGVQIRRTLTGFKYIGEQIGKLEAAGHAERFVFGFEESYGYLAGTHVRDKDAIVASMLICQMARHYRGQGMNLAQAMRALYDEYGWYRNQSTSVQFEGADGARAMDETMAHLRQAPPSQVAGLAVKRVVDYQQGIGELPPANVVELDLEQGQKVLIRPSGTEPKIKGYLFAKASTRAIADDTCARLRGAVEDMLGTRA